VGGGSDGSGRNDAGQSRHVELLHKDLGDAGLCVSGYLLNCKCRLCSGNPTVSGAGIAWRGVERSAACQRSDQQRCPGIHTLSKQSGEGNLLRSIQPIELSVDRLMRNLSLSWGTGGFERTRFG